MLVPGPDCSLSRADRDMILSSDTDLSAYDTLNKIISLCQTLFQDFNASFHVILQVSFKYSLSIYAKLLFVVDQTNRSTLQPNLQTKAEIVARSKLTLLSFCIATSWPKSKELFRFPHIEIFC